MSKRTSVCLCGRCRHFDVEAVVCLLATDPVYTLDGDVTACVDGERWEPNDAKTGLEPKVRRGKR
jgi:hypothetical protein